MDRADELRRRRNKKSEPSNIQDHEEVKLHNTPILNLPVNTFWLTRIVLLRAISFVFFVAFLVALHQNKALIGKNGLLPADTHLNNIKQHTKDNIWNMVKYAPTLLWLCDYNENLDSLLDLLAYCGLILSGFVLIFGCANIILMLVIWTLYLSIVNVGQRWYGFGWESQILETSFLAAFLCPLFSLKPVPKHSPTSRIVLLAFLWLIFRIMIGAGLIKIRGDQCWRDLTCMNYHYQTQPVPNPNALYMHHAPEWWHKVETSGNHFVELVAPFCLLLTRKFRIMGGIIQIMFQVVLIISGNLSFLNWLTIIPSVACFDDSALSFLFSGRRGSVKWQVHQLQMSDSSSPNWGNHIRKVFNIFFGCLIAYLSIPIVQNLISSRQIMNTSFDPLRIVNTYGAFGSVTKERTEVIIMGTNAVNPNDPDAQWLEYEFNCKPGNVTRRPCFISPYHYRLDWLMWFAAFQTYQHNNWLIHMVAKFLVNDRQTSELIAHNPFIDDDPPKWIKAEHYKYTFTDLNSKAYNSGKWWNRRRIGEYLPPVSLNTLQDYLKNMGWRVPRLHGGSKKKKVPTATLR